MEAFIMAAGQRLPAGAFRTYGLGVSLRAMLNPAAAQARVPVTPDQDSQ